MQNVLLVLHILGGSLALISGIPAMLARKGSKLHSQSGLFYFSSMAFTGVSGLLLALLSFNLFLFPISIFTLYMVLSGRIMIRLRNKPAQTKPLIGLKYLAIPTLLTGVFMVGYGCYWLMQGQNMAIVLCVFGAITLGMSLGDLAAIHKKKWTEPVHYLRQHISRMGGSYIAATTAFFSVQIHFLPPVLVWLLPSLIGSLLISFAIRRTFQNPVANSDFLK